MHHDFLAPCRPLGRTQKDRLSSPNAAVLSSPEGRHVKVEVLLSLEVLESMHCTVHAQAAQMRRAGCLCSAHKGPVSVHS